MLAVGGNYISTFNNDIYQDDISFSNVSFNDVFIYDNSCAMAVGDEAVIYYSRDYLNQDWDQLTSDYVNTMPHAQYIEAILVISILVSIFTLNRHDGMSTSIQITVIRAIQTSIGSNTSS